jgi:two-component system, LytTR family, response regulator
MNSKYKCIIADDNIIDRDVVEMYAAKIPEISIHALCSDGLEAAAVIKEQHIDIVFSDIDMPELSGLELVKTLQNTPVFIFISAHGEHAAESYNLDVIDFIVKPVTLARLMKATNKAIEYIKLKKTALVSISENGPAPSNGNDHFFIREDNGYTKIVTADVIVVESMGSFSVLKMVSQKKHITLVGLKNVEAQLPSKLFIRVHKQFIINLKHIAAYSSDGELKLSDGSIIPVGATFKASLLELINKKILLR